MVLGRLRKEQAMLTGNTPPTPPSESLGDLIKAFSDLVSDPKAGKKLLADLTAATESHKAAAAEAAAAMKQAELHRGKTLNEIDNRADARNAALDQREKEITARLAAREKAVEARERATIEREARAEALLSDAAEKHAAVRKKIDAYDAA
jgi:hypothetical protein